MSVLYAYGNFHFTLKVTNFRRSPLVAYKKSMFFSWIQRCVFCASLVSYCALLSRVCYFTVGFVIMVSGIVALWILNDYDRLNLVSFEEINKMQVLLFSYFH